MRRYSLEDVDDIAKEFGLLKNGLYEYTLPGANPNDFLIRYNCDTKNIDCAEHIRSKLNSFWEKIDECEFGFKGIQSVTKEQARMVIMKIIKEYKQLLNDYRKKELEKDFK